MAIPTADAEYHLLKFIDIGEAAAFVAALSRFLSSPSGSKYFRPSAPAEVWSRVLGPAYDIERVEVYMNASALGAVAETFLRPPATETLRGNQMPPDCISLIGAGGAEAWGLEEAQWHMLSEG